MISDRELLRRVTTRRVCEYHLGDSSYQNAMIWLNKQWHIDYGRYKGLKFRFVCVTYTVRGAALGMRIVGRGKKDV